MLQQRDINLLSFFFWIDHTKRENPLFSLSAEHETVKSDWELRHGVASCGTIRGPSMICCALSRAAGRAADPSQGFMTDSAPFFFSFRFLAAKSLWRGMRIILNHKLLLLSLFVCVALIGKIVHQVLDPSNALFSDVNVPGGRGN